MPKITYPILYITRKEHGHNQAYVAKKLNISKQRYSLKELGKAYFTLPEAEELSKLYGLSVDELFSREFPINQ